MPRRISDQVYKKTLDAWMRNGYNYTAAARELGVSNQTVKNRIDNMPVTQFANKIANGPKIKSKAAAPPVDPTIVMNAVKIQSINAKDDKAQESLDAYAKFGSKAKAARELGIAPQTLENRLAYAKKRGMKPSDAAIDSMPSSGSQEDVEISLLRKKLSQMTSMLKSMEENRLTEDVVRTSIFGLSEAAVDPKVPDWMVETKKSSMNGPGVPCLFASDWHWGEIVDPSQINGVNSYDLDIATIRAQTMVNGAIDICFNHMVQPKYPGLVFILGGDMVTGDIHEELMATNEMEIMPTFVSLHGALIGCISKLADAFGRVFIPCVSGNHGRNTHKIRAKGRNATNFDWLLYVMLEKYFESDQRIQFYIPNGPDARFSIYSHRYLLTHGDQFRGGDGMIGALGPVIRGDHKKRTRNGQIDMDYDTMLLGHWHQLIQLNKVIINGSLKGYDEYAYSNNFSFEPPQQALWFTHPTRGITSSWPVQVELKEPTSNRGWVSWDE